MNEELKLRIEVFFDYWRQRHAFIRNLDFINYGHEANVLLWASLDALSNLWSENIGKEQCRGKGKRIIFDAFLAHYGGDLFQLVSLPDVWNRIDRNDICLDQKSGLKLPENVCAFLREVGGRRIPSVKEERQNRFVSDDWRMDEIIAETLENLSEINHNELEKWLTLSRYGAIAYKQMRSAYIHRGLPCTHDFELHGAATEPTYLSKIYTTPPIIGFKIEFMLLILEHCINGFEADALTVGKDPVPE